MAKKALLIGINYPGTPVELRGCVNDVHRMQKCLIDRFGFAQKDITVLVDTDKSSVRPTGKNIREALTKLIDSGKAGDCLVFHYSGHGTRIPPAKGKDIDSTGFDECITPCDWNLIMDHEFRTMVSKVKDGCRLTIISDSCHSGGLIEEVKEQIGESHVKQQPKPEVSEFGESHVKQQPKPKVSKSMLSIVMNYLFATCGTSRTKRDTSGGGLGILTTEIELENGETVEMKSRYLPPDTLISLLEQQTGQTNIDIRKIRTTLIQAFGDDASPRVLSNSMKINGHRGSLGRTMGKDDVNYDGVMTRTTSSSDAKNGILLSGCQTNERSEDVYVTRTGKAYGAFSDAIQTILSETKMESKITNKEMILEARKVLKRKNFGQRPGLYCHDDYVNAPFIC